MPDINVHYSFPVVRRALQRPLQRTFYSRLGQYQATKANPWRAHLACDVEVLTGTAVFPVRPGEVTYADYYGDLGLHMRIRDGLDEWSYSHLSDIGVSAHAMVALNSKVAVSGATGNASGPHVHIMWAANTLGNNPYGSFPYKDPFDALILAFNVGNFPPG